MNRFSIVSLLTVIAGGACWLYNYSIQDFNERLVFIGFILLLLGVVGGFGAIARGEKGFLKFVPITFFFVLMFLVCWFDPFQIIRMMAWIKN